MGGKWLKFALALLISLNMLGSSAYANDINANMQTMDANTNMLIMEEIHSNRHTQPYSAQAAVNRLTLEGFEQVMANSRLEVYLRAETGGLRVVNRQTGYVWGGTKEDDLPELNNTWDAIGNSMLYMEYYDDKALPKSVGIGAASVKKEYTVSGDILTVSVTFTEQNIALAFTVTLKDNSLVFHLEDTTIREEGGYRIGSLYFFSFMGATLADEIEGYTFVPDGCGALIRFAKPARYLVAYDKRVYGDDFAIDSLTTLNDLKSKRPNDFATPEQTLTMPVFGMVHGNDQAYYSVLENGMEYAAITAHPSGVVTDFNRAAARFIYRQLYLQPVTRKGDGVQMLQKERNAVNPTQAFYFLNGEDAGYVGIAKAYRQYLADHGRLPEAGTPITDIGVKLDFLCADIKNIFLFNTTMKITSPGYIRDGVRSLIEEGALKNISVTLLGWQKGGLNGYKKNKIFDRVSIGSKSEWTALQAELTQTGGALALQLDPVTAKPLQADINAHVGITLSQALIKITRDNPLIWFKDTYYLKPALASDILSRQTQALHNAGYSHIALDGYGRYLYAENLQGRVVTRTQAMALQEETVGSVSRGTEKLSLYAANEYLWRYADELLNMPMVNSQFLFETDSVPFMQIVLSGTAPMYAPYSNLGLYTPMDILKHIDYGVYPSFLLTEAENYELVKTGSSDLYSTCFKDWQTQIIESYQTVNNVLKHVAGQTIESRDIPSKGIVVTGYSGGGTVIVNYTGEAYDYGGVSVPGLSAVYKEGGGGQ